MNAHDGAVWPNLVLYAGDLYGLGAAKSLPAGFSDLRPSPAPRAATGRRARPLGPCVATSATGRDWLMGSGLAGLQPMLVDGDVVMLPTSPIAPHGRNSA